MRRVDIHSNAMLGHTAHTRSLRLLAAPRLLGRRTLRGAEAQQISSLERDLEAVKLREQKEADKLNREALKLQRKCDALQQGILAVHPPCARSACRLCDLMKHR